MVVYNGKKWKREAFGGEENVKFALEIMALHVEGKKNIIMHKKREI